MVHYEVLLAYVSSNNSINVLSATAPEDVTLLLSALIGTSVDFLGAFCEPTRRDGQRNAGILMRF